MIVQILKIAVHCKKGKEPQGKTNGVCACCVLLLQSAPSSEGMCEDF